MFDSRYRSIVAGLVLGGVSVFLTFLLRSLVFMDPNIVMRALKATGVAFVVPGLMFALIVENVHALRHAAGNSQPFGFPVMASVNFLFWFGFGWLFATFVSMLTQLRRAIAAGGLTRAPGPRAAEVASRGEGAGSSSPRSAAK
jgi:hypothetical protein